MLVAGQHCAGDGVVADWSLCCSSVRTCLLCAALFLPCSDIAAGEQIFLSYINEEQSKTERRADLRDYGFVCQCARCQTEESDQEEGGEDDDDDGEVEGPSD